MYLYIQYLHCFMISVVLAVYPVASIGLEHRLISGSTLTRRGHIISQEAFSLSPLNKRQTVIWGTSDDCKNCNCNLNSLNSCSSKCALKCQKPQKCHSCSCEQEGNLCDHDCRICKPEEANEPNQHCDACPFLCADNQCDCFAYAAWGQCLDGDDADCKHSKLSCGEYVGLFCESITKDLKIYSDGSPASCSFPTQQQSSSMGNNQALDYLEIES